MIGLTAASVPLYRLFCAATGYGGTTQRATAAPADVAKAIVTVRFNTEISHDLNWEFRPLQSEVQVHPGEQTQVFFRAVNRSREGVTGPGDLQRHADQEPASISTSCSASASTQQYLAPGESKDMGVVFFVDPDMLKDPDTETSARSRCPIRCSRRQDAENRQTRAELMTDTHADAHAAHGMGTMRQSTRTIWSIRARGRWSARSRPG